MKRWILMISSSLLLSSCTPCPPTEGQCEVIAEKRLQYFIDKSPPEAASDKHSERHKDLDFFVKLCKSGSLNYDYSDYRCFKKAGTHEAIEKFINAEVKQRK